jgi:hypothetical protein
LYYSSGNSDNSYSKNIDSSSPLNYLSFSALIMNDKKLWPLTKGKTVGPMSDLYEGYEKIK